MPSFLDDTEIVQKYLASSSDLGTAYRELATWLKAKAEEGAWDDLAEVMPRLIVPGLDYTSAMSLHRMVREVGNQARVRNRRVKIAVLGSFTTHQLVTLLDLYLRAGRLDAEIHEADYGIFRQELIDPESELYQFRPDFIILATSWRDLGHRPVLSDDRAEVHARSRRR